MEKLLNKYSILIQPHQNFGKLPSLLEFKLVSNPFSKSGFRCEFLFYMSRCLPFSRYAAGLGNREQTLHDTYISFLIRQHSLQWTLPVSWWLCPRSPKGGASDPGLSPLTFMDHTWPGPSQGDAMTLSLYLLEKRFSLITSDLKCENEWLAETFLVPIKLQAKVNRIEGRTKAKK